MCSMKSDQRCDPSKRPTEKMREDESSSSQTFLTSTLDLNILFCFSGFSRLVFGTTRSLFVSGSLRTPSRLFVPCLIPAPACGAHHRPIPRGTAVQLSLFPSRMLRCVSVILKLLLLLQYHDAASWSNQLLWSVNITAHGVLNE